MTKKYSYQKDKVHYEQREGRSACNRSSIWGMSLSSNKDNVTCATCLGILYPGAVERIKETRKGQALNNARKERIAEKIKEVERQIENLKNELEINKLVLSTLGV